MILGWLEKKHSIRSCVLRAVCDLYTTHHDSRYCRPRNVTKLEYKIPRNMPNCSETHKKNWISFRLVPYYGDRQWRRPKTGNRWGGDCIVGNILTLPLVSPILDILAIVSLLLLYM